MEYYKDLPLLHFDTQTDWLIWLEANHSSVAGIWVRFAKKNTGIPSMTYAEARDGALMYGWIDGVKNRIDDTYYALRFVPRRAKSVWSKINCEIAETLIAEGKMKPAGLVQVEAAKADGRWDNAYASQSKMTIPPELQAAFDKNPDAKAFYETITKANQYAFLYRIHTAKKPETRARHVQKTIDMLLEGRTIH